ncbi:DUF202 domain-containing protein [Corynebacterium alimapuense]|uniref:DUF202 domain-containing protein n=1 Tax=Corynebacterium alimapuense TaxID=1576874 RepID=A0A3M8KB31_9CORY|nr:DUF202 domain-containing protein [Corynebacterium alimapuense]RNE49668.1 hypothetical protein C5L39_04860 [Corynebacterium alimapuense]
MTAPPQLNQVSERNTLSWTRTSLELALVSTLLLRRVSDFGFGVLALIGLLLTMALAITLSQHSRYRVERHGLRDDSVPAGIGSVFTITAMLLVLGAGSIMLILGSY